MKEPLRSQKINKLIKEKRESIHNMLSDESFLDWLIETRDTIRAKDQQLAEERERA